MSIIGSNTLAGASGQGGAYEIEQSLRFNAADTPYLNFTPSSKGNATTWTWSGWVKLSATPNTYNKIFQAYYGGSSRYFILWFIRNGTYDYLQAVGGLYSTSPTSEIITLQPQQRFRDYSAWYHIVFTYDSGNATSSDRCRIYVNGARVTDFTSSTYPSQNSETFVNQSTTTHYLGDSVSSETHGGYLAEVNFIDGSALDHEDFGELDDNGVWRPKKYAGSYTGQSWYLKFASGDGTDSSGLSNTWTANNFTTSGTGTDVMSDTPTTNWCTLNPTAKVIDSGSLPYNKLELSDGNLGLYGEYGNVIGTIGVTSGKWYWEVEAGNGIMAGVSDKPQVATSNVIPGVFSRSAAWNVYYADTTNILNNGYTVNSGTLTAATTSGDIVGVALDMDAGEIRYYLNGTIQNSGNAVVSGITGTAFPIFRGSRDGVRYVNFGQRAFDISSIPTGYSALNTANLPAPDIADGSDNFNTVLWTGTSAENPISTVGFQPDFTWIKGRDNNTGHILVDAVRGATKVLESDVSAAEYTNAQSVKSFDTNGFTLGTENDVNNSTAGYNQYVAWNWLAANGTEVLTTGSINSTVSANPTAGFSIVSYTGNGSGSATIAHGLGVKPQMVIVKSRSNSSTYWTTYHESISAGTTYCLELNTTAYKDQVNDTFFGSTQTFNGTVFSVGYPGAASNSTNANNYTYIAYCFAEVEGYSKFGSYTGNGSTDGPFVYCGFKPAMIIIKQTDAANRWVISDTTRDPINPNEGEINPNDSAAEYATTTANYDLLSNGFKFRRTGDVFNGSNKSYVFMAWAENPFGGSGVSPATAR